MSEQPSRRTVLRVAGVAGAGVAAGGALSACSGSSATQGAGTAATTAVANAAGALAKTADIPVGGGKIVDKVVVTQPVAGTFKAFSAICTHQGCTVTSIASGKIDCACHGSVFDAATGAVITGPAARALAEQKISVADGSISLA